MQTTYSTIRDQIPRGRPRLSEEERKRSERRNVLLRQCASLARGRTLMLFKRDFPELYEQYYRQEYEALKAERTPMLYKTDVTVERIGDLGSSEV